MSIGKNRPIAIVPTKIAKNTIMTGSAIAESIVSLFSIICSYKFAYEPINDAFSHLYGFDEKDEFVGQIRLNHKHDERLLPAAQILEDNFHIYSFYKQQDVQKAFEFSTKVVEEA